MLALNVAAAVALVGLIVATSGDRLFALGFCGAAIAALALFRGGAWALAAGARRLGHLRRPALRLGLANLHRPGSPAALLVVSLGIGLTTLAAIAQIEGNLRRQLGGRDAGPRARTSSSSTSSPTRPSASTPPRWPCRG